jgi:hypothetical protein
LNTNVALRAVLERVAHDDDVPEVGTLPAYEYPD